MSSRPRCGGFIYFNADRWRSEKQKGTPEETYRHFTNLSGNLWQKLSNLEQSTWDAKAAFEPFCQERARLKSLTPEQAKEEDCTACRAKCDVLKDQSERLARKANRLSVRAERGKQPLPPFFEFSAAKKGEYPGMSPVQRAKLLGVAWRALGDQEKKAFETVAYSEWRESRALARGGFGARLKRKLA